jgi:hypothetical protein
MGIFKTFKDMKETAAEHGGMPNLRDSYTDISKTFDDRGEREILKSGITAMGIVRGFTTPVPGDRFAMSIPIEVHPPEGAPYTIDYVFPTVRMQAAITAGMEIPIKISTEDPNKIAVQWDAQKAQIAAAGGSMAAVTEALSSTYGPATQAAMDQAMKNFREGTSGSVPVTTSQPDAQSRIEKLDQLKNAGLIDEAAYNAKKQKIIDEI